LGLTLLFTAIQAAVPTLTGSPWFLVQYHLAFGESLFEDFLTFSLMIHSF
jgi:hypothetical protein